MLINHLLITLLIRTSPECLDENDIVMLTWQGNVIDERCSKYGLSQSTNITEPLKKLYLIEHMRVQQLFLIIEHILTAGYQ